MNMRLEIYQYYLITYTINAEKTCKMEFLEFNLLIKILFSNSHAQFYIH